MRARALAGVCGMQGSGSCAGAHLRSSSRHASDPLLARPSSRAAPGCACARRLGSHGHARALAGRRPAGTPQLLAPRRKYSANRLRTLLARAWRRGASPQGRLLRKRPS